MGWGGGGMTDSLRQLPAAMNREHKASSRHDVSPPPREIYPSTIAAKAGGEKFAPCVGGPLAGTGGHAGSRAADGVPSSREKNGGQSGVSRRRRSRGEGELRLGRRSTSLRVKLIIVDESTHDFDVLISLGSGVLFRGVDQGRSRHRLINNADLIHSAVCMSDIFLRYCSPRP